MSKEKLKERNGSSSQKKIITRKKGKEINENRRRQAQGTFAKMLKILDQKKDLFPREESEGEKWYRREIVLFF